MRPAKAVQVQKDIKVGRVSYDGGAGKASARQMRRTEKNKPPPIRSDSTAELSFMEEGGAGGERMVRRGGGHARERKN